MHCRGWSFGSTVSLTTGYAIVFLLHVLLAPFVVDGFLIPHRKDEFPEDTYVQQLGVQLSDRLRDVKKGKKGLSISLLNVNVDDKPISSHSHVVRKQCNATGEKVDCASYGVRRSDCLDRGCCYAEIHDSPEPWCYLPETSLVAQCRGRQESRLQCGYYNIRNDECESLSCCWRPTDVPGTPWCYHADPDTQRPETTPLQPPASQCGLTPIEPNVNLRIVGGVEAVAHSWPWVVSLQANGHHNCGGSLINDRWVVTAAHCRPIFSNLEESSVVVGVHSLDSPNAAYTERFKVELIISNEKYRRFANDVSNDIMLIKLAKKVTFNKAVQPVCLPQPFQTFSSGTRCWTTGWGLTDDEPESGSNVLNQVALPLIDIDVCNMPELYDNELDDTMVCAGYEEGGKDSCKGDSGGPLVCHDNGRWILHGVVSWGHGCAQVNKPGLYARTSAYVKWITRNIAEN